MTISIFERLVGEVLKGVTWFPFSQKLANLPLLLVAGALAFIWGARLIWGIIYFIERVLALMFFVEVVMFLFKF